MEDPLDPNLLTMRMSYDWIPARSTREWQPFVLLF